MISKWETYRWVTPLKIVAWVVFGMFLTVAATLLSVVSLLSPQKLTALTMDVANRDLNADVYVCDVRISLRGSYPFLNLDVDSLVVISRDIARLTGDTRKSLPAWADTLASVGHLHGGINIVKFFHGKIDLRDLNIRNPQINVLVVNRNLNNFSITKLTADSMPVTMPEIRLNRFSLTDPKPLRYADLSQGSYLIADIHSATMTDTPVTTGDLPVYRMDFRTNITSPILSIIGRNTIPVALDGIVEWNHKAPYGLTLQGLRFDICGISGMVNTYMTFYDRLTVHNFDFAFDPIDVNKLLGLMPKEFMATHHLPSHIDTDGHIDFSGHILSPYIIGVASPPDGILHIGVPSCSVSWPGTDIDHVGLDAMVRLYDRTEDFAKIDIRSLDIKGKGIDIDAQGVLTDLLADTRFVADINASVDISRLPSATISPSVYRGRIEARGNMSGTRSMLTANGFHRIKINGDISIDSLYYLGADTLSMVSIPSARIRLGNTDFHRHAADSLLRMHLDIDTMDILAKGMDIRIGGISLDAAANDLARYCDTTLVAPMTGRLALKRFSAYTLGRPDGLSASGCRGKVSMSRWHGDMRLPMFDIDLTLPSVVAGTPQTHFHLDNARLKATLAQTSHRVASQSAPVSTPRSSRHKYIRPDSVYILANMIHNRGVHKPRIHMIQNTRHEDMIDWGTSSIFTRFLTHWLLRGSLTVPSGYIDATWIKLPNRISDLKVSFDDNDILLAGVKYTMGRSDINLSGSVRNMKRAFIDRNWSKALKIDFDMHSHMIDIDQLIATYSAFDAPTPGDSTATTSTAASPAWLLPINLDAGCTIHADKVVYSDITFYNAHGVGGLGDGKISIDTLRATTTAGTIGVSGQYCAQRADSLSIGFDMSVEDFNLAHFMRLVPTLDSIMPVMRHLQGTVNACVAAHSRITPQMHLVMPSFTADIHLEGDSLGMIGNPELRHIEKFLLLKHKEGDLIRHLAVDMTIRDERLNVKPFVFDFNRYRLGVYGYNTLNMHFDYHIAVLKSPIPFRFGVEVEGDPHHHKIHFGGPGNFWK